MLGQNHWKARRNFFRALAYIFAILIAVTTFFPLYTMLISSTHDSYNIVTQINVLPGSSFGRNYARLTDYYNIWRGFFNSFALALVSVACVLYLSALTAYGFSKFRFRGRGALFGVVLVAMMLPGQLGIIGFYKQMDMVGLLDSYLPLIISGAVNCFAVFLFKQYLDTALPNDLIEAAYIDGCSERHIFHRMALPMMRPILVTQGVLSFIGSWNSYMTPLIILFSPGKMTLPLMVATVRDTMNADFGAQYVGMLISVIPLIIVYCFASKVIMEEISVGVAIKG